MSFKRPKETAMLVKVEAQVKRDFCFKIPLKVLFLMVDVLAKVGPLTKNFFVKKNVLNTNAINDLLHY